MPRSLMPKSAGNSLKGKTALVTGGNRGIGLAIANALVSAGAQVIITGRDAAKLRSAAKRLSARGAALSVDVRDAQQVKNLFRDVKKRFGRLDFLINNAGVAHANLAVEKMSLDVWQSVMATNLDGLFLVTHYALPVMRNGGVIINNLSRAAVQPFMGMSAYNTSKAGALAFTNSLRMELRKRGIRVTALIPGAIETDIWEQFWADAPRDKMLGADAVARAVLHVLTLPTDATIEQLQIGPAAGDL
jgi:NAD(P)-dependent dehydrogenase (short-subunit alcohol dehydrogenase family)